MSIMENEHECILFKKINNNVQCHACSHRCIISDGKTGICGVRKNKSGRLYLLVYGKLSAMQVDPIEKKPLYHFLPGTYTFSISTIGCNFRCLFCQNYHISQTNISQINASQTKDSKYLGNLNFNLKHITPEEVVAEAEATACKSLAYTYNEPAIFLEFVRDVAVLAKKKNLKNLLVTNGYFSEESLSFISDVVDAMNIDLKSFKDEFYTKICGAKLQPVLDTIKRAYEKGIHIELTTLVIPGENDTDSEFEKIAKFIAGIDKNIPWHISRFFPMYKMNDKIATPLETLQRAEKIGKKYLNYVHLGNV